MFKLRVFASVLSLAAWLGQTSATAFGQDAAPLRPRLVVLTDFFKDPDDKQSMIRLLTAANEVELEGLIATSLAFGDGSVRPELIHEVLDLYAKVVPQLQQHDRPGFEYPAAEALHAMVRAGAPVIRRLNRRQGFSVPYPPGKRDSRSSDPAEKWIGSEHDTAASRHLIEVVDRPDARPVWVAVWGGSMDLAQALWRVKHDRSAEDYLRFVRKLRVHQINWQDTGTVWIWNNVPELFCMIDVEMHSGYYREVPEEWSGAAWVARNVTQGHGPLGAAYPKAGPPGLKEGDTPSFLNFLAAGLTDLEQPEWGGWGGRFQRFEASRNLFVDGRDSHPQSDEVASQKRWTIARWYPAVANDFAARLDWCVKSYADSNHHPLVQVDGDGSQKVLQRKLPVGGSVSLNAEGTSDPDGQALDFQWFQYLEPGTPGLKLKLDHAEGPRVTVSAPGDAPAGKAHLILAVTDRGEPPLTRYRRIVFSVGEKD